MTNWYILEKEAEYKQRAFQKEADILRKLETLQPAQTSKDLLVRFLLAKLGQKLVEVGTLLQARYGVSVLRN